MALAQIMISLTHILRPVLTSSFRTMMFIISTLFMMLGGISVGNYYGILFGIPLVAVSYFASKNSLCYMIGIFISLFGLIGILQKPTLFVSKSGVYDQILRIGIFGGMAVGFSLFVLHMIFSGRYND